MSKASIKARLMDYKARLSYLENKARIAYGFELTQARAAIKAVKSEIKRLSMMMMG